MFNVAVTGRSSHGPSSCDDDDDDDDDHESDHGSGSE
jgi:hypothetical protein